LNVRRAGAQPCASTVFENHQSPTTSHQPPTTAARLSFSKESIKLFLDDSIALTGDFFQTSPVDYSYPAPIGADQSPVLERDGCLVDIRAVCSNYLAQKFLGKFQNVGLYAVSALQEKPAEPLLYSMLEFTQM
jgi:hypothetical protein